MPSVRLVAYEETHGHVPFEEWLAELPDRARLKCLERLERLQALGHELRRPEADDLREGIYELRTKHLRVNYRILYFFHGRTAVVLSHGFSKQAARVPQREIAAALWRKRRFERRPEEHAASWSLDR